MKNINIQQINFNKKIPKIINIEYDLKFSNYLKCLHYRQIVNRTNINTNSYTFIRHTLKHIKN